MYALSRAVAPFGVADGKVMLNIQRYGNTSAATLPFGFVGLRTAVEEGDNLIFTAFGAGFTWGAAYMNMGL